MNSGAALKSGFLRPLLSIGVGMALAALLMLASGYRPMEAFAALGTGATGLEAGPASAPNQIALGPLHLNLFLLAQSLAKVTPLIFIGLAIALGLRAGMFNIGAQGQMLSGALLAAVVGRWGAQAGERLPTGTLPIALHVPLVLLAGCLGGALAGALAGFLKAWRGVHEVISTIMLNYVAANVALYLVTHNLKDPGSSAQQTAAIAQSAWFVALVPGGNLTLGFFLALFAAALYAFVIQRTALGFQIRAVGLGAEAARANGIPVTRTLITTMALSGGLAGLAGAIEVMGVHHRYVQGVAGNYGFDGIAVALLGNLSGVGVALAALFFGALASGATFMQSQTNVPDSIAVIVQALVILFVGVRVLPLSGFLKPVSTAASLSDPDHAENAAPPAAEQVAENAPL